MIFFRKALLKTQTPHSNCLYQWEFESEYWEMFSDIFWLSTHTGYISASVRTSIERGSWNNLTHYSNSALKLDNSVRVWGRVLRLVLGFFLTPDSQWIIQWELEGEVRIIFFRKVLLKTQTPHSNCLYQCECEVKIIFSRKALLKTQTPHSNCLYQWECESEYRERFLNKFWLPT